MISSLHALRSGATFVRVLLVADSHLICFCQKKNVVKQAHSSCACEVVSDCKKWAALFGCDLSADHLNDINKSLQEAAMTYGTGESVRILNQEPSKSLKRKALNEMVTVVESTGLTEESLHPLLLEQIKKARVL